MDLPAWAWGGEAGIRRHADRLAVRHHVHDIPLHRARYYAHIEGVIPPDRRRRPEITDAGERARYACERWWRRGLRRMIGRRGENWLRIRGQDFEQQPYISDWGLERYREAAIRSREGLSHMVAESDDGQSVPLLDCIAGSVANPAIRRGEMMTRIRGLEDEGERRHLSARFVTLTAPGRMHVAGESHYDGSSVRAVSRYLARVWARTRAAWAKAGIAVYGLRIAEPHRDGTPHWHILLWAAEDRIDEAAAILRARALSDAPNEPGAQQHRCKCVVLGAGGAAAYVAKYVGKNIDGEGVEWDHTADLAAAPAAERVTAWASCWGVRQFQFFGCSPVGVWRELRRAQDGAPAEWADLWTPADSGDWAGYTRAYSNNAARLAVVWSDAPGAYTDPVGNMVRGLERPGAPDLWTRSRIWCIKWAATAICGAASVGTLARSALGLVAITVEASENHGLNPKRTNDEDQGIDFPGRERSGQDEDGHRRRENLRSRRRYQLYERCTQ